MTSEIKGSFRFFLKIIAGAVCLAVSENNIDAQTCLAPPSGLVSWWPGQNNTLDFLGANNGAAQGGLTYAPGEVGEAFSFNGASAGVMVPASASLNVGAGSGLTIDLWMNPATLTGAPLVEWDGPNVFESNFGFSAPTLAGGTGPGCLYVDLKEANFTDHIISSGPGLIATNIFQHVAVTYNQASGAAVLYLNGAAVASTNLGSFTPGTSGNLYFGYRAAGDGAGTLWYQGLLDEVDVFNRVLAPSEIQAIYIAGSAGKCQSPTSPSIVLQPQSQTLTVDNNAVFSVVADGVVPFSYQWYFNQTNLLAYATNSTLVLTNIQTTNAGNYSVIVTNINGSTPSSNALLSVTAQAVCDPPPSGMVTWWQGEGNANDALGTNNGTLQGGMTFVPGEVGQAFAFDGTTADVMLPASASLNVGSGNGFTIDLWINPTNLAVNQPLVEWDGSTGFESLFWISAPTLAGGTGPGCLYADLKDASLADHIISSAAGLLSTNIFQHVAVTFDRPSGVAALYYNGVQVTNLNLGAILPVTTGNLYLGLRAAGGGTGLRYQGLMDEVDVFNRALAPSEILAIYNTGSLGKCDIAPTITTQPQSQSVLVSNVATFSVAVRGSYPLNYQWYFNSTNLISGATDSMLSLTNVQGTNGGNYSVTVANSGGQITSSNAVLSVTMPAASPSGLVSWWRAEGDTRDSAGTNNGVAQGGVTYAPGEVGQAFNFNGTNADVMIPASAALNVGQGVGFTIESWINPANVAVQIPIMEWNAGAPTDYGVHFWVATPGPAGGGPGCLFVNILDTGGVSHYFATAAGVVTTNAWQHVAVTYNATNGTAIIYYNGSIVASSNLGIFTPQTTYNAYLGARIAGIPSPSYFTGLMDEVSLYSRALSPSEIAGIYNAGSLGKAGLGPNIVIQPTPTNQTVSGGANVIYTVTATGSDPLGYQWKLNGTNLTGATASTLALANVQTTNSGTYTVIVSNAFGSPITSSNAVLAVSITPLITNQPAGQSVVAGNTAIFSVGATSTYPLTFQWFFNQTNLLLGATNSLLILNNVGLTNAGGYSVAVSNIGGPTLSSNALLSVTLPVCDPPPSGLVGWWAAEGDALDILGTNNGALQGGMAFAPGKDGQAFSFNGSNANVMIPASSSLNVGIGGGLTIECWINPGDIISKHALVEWNNGVGLYGSQFWISETFGGGGPGSLYANLFDTQGIAHTLTTPAGTVGTNGFQHVAITYSKSSGVMTMYYNGVPIQTENVGSFVPQTTYNLYLGDRPSSSPPGFYYGLIDEVSVYNRALSQSEIQAIYNASYAGKCLPVATLPPSITTQPLSQPAILGTNITLTVGAGGSAPLSYQWKLNNTNITGASASILTITNFQPTNDGAYSVAVGNGLGSVTSTVASVAIYYANIYANGQALTNFQYQFAQGTAVTITMTNVFAGGPMFYTVDGSTPSAGVSPLYSGAFVIANNTTLRVLSYKSDFSQSGFSFPISFVFVPTYTVTPTTAGGGTIALNPPTGPYVSNSVVTLAATPTNGWTFFEWTGDAIGTNTNTTVTVTRNENVQAVFGTSLTTTIAPTGAGTISVNPPGGLYPFGTTVLLTAIPAPGNEFLLWDDAVPTTSVNPLSFTVNNTNQTISSLFGTLGGSQLTLTAVPLGRGTINVNPSAATYTNNQSVTLTALPTAGFSFTGWTGGASGLQNPLTVNVTSNTIVYGNFTHKNTLSFAPLGQHPVNQGFELILNGEIGSSYRIDGSSDLIHWTPLITFTNGFGVMQFIDFSSSSNSDRFYRSVPLQ